MSGTAPPVAGAPTGEVRLGGPDADDLRIQGPRIEGPAASGPRRRRGRGVFLAARPDLPSPPPPAERYHYLGPQRRRVMVAQGLASIVTALALLAFFAGHPVIAVFALPLALNLVYAVLSLLTTTMRRRVDRADHERRVVTWRPDRHPSVDVFLPSCGEPLEILRNTYRYVAGLRWPGPLRILVLDDSARDGVARLAAEFGFEYLTRPDRGVLKKAGNLRFGLERSGGEFVVVLDADFCPEPDFLAELVPYFDEPDVAIVQSPQYFDSRRPATWLQRAAGSVQEIFYRWVQPSRDAVDGAICVGTCAVYRRSALEQVGGFAQIGHSEDVHTGMRLLKRGFRLRYVPVLVSRGVCPDGVDGFLSQQYRWCAGSMSLLTDRTFHNSGLTLRQRMCFWTGFLYYITTAVTFFTGPASAVALLWLLPDLIAPLRYLPLIALSWLTFWMWNRVTRARWDLSVVRVQLLYSAAHALAIWHTVRGSTADWVPTGAAGRGVPLATTVRRIVVVWLTAFLVAAWGGVARALITAGWERFWLSTALAMLAAVIMLPVIRVCARPDAPSRLVRVSRPGAVPLARHAAHPAPAPVPARAPARPGR